MTLYIIGNGFDIHHNVKCSYSNYKIWLEQNEPDVYSRLNTIYGNPDIEWWNQFEQSLADVKHDYTKMLASMTFGEKQERLNSLYGNTDAIDNFEINGGDINNAENLNEAIINYEVLALIDDIKGTFHSWIDELKTEEPFEVVKFDNPKEDIFLNFNYTITLEDQNGSYKIDPDKVTHIHGKIGDSEYVIGHGLDLNALLNKDLENVDFDFDPDDERNLIELSGRNEVLGHIENLRKKIEDQIEFKKGFFNNLENVDKVVFLGFSYSPIDMPYMDEIFDIIGKDVQIVAHWHSEGDKERLTKYFVNFPQKNITTPQF